MLNPGSRHPEVKAEQGKRVEFEVEKVQSSMGVGKKKEESLKLSRKNARVGLG